jgi:5-methylthioribose kinase
MQHVITQENLPAYLLANGFVPEGAVPHVEALGWGISNTVLKVEMDGDCFVVKQPLPKLRVADDWPFDRSRVFIERDCMAMLADLLPPGSVPEVRFSDDANYVFAMSCAPEGAVLWEEALLDGRIDAAAAERTAALLALLHSRAAADPRGRERFDDVTNFVQGRTDPYHKTAALAHPDLAPYIDAEVARMLRSRRTLVHGDYSPKNMFLHDDQVFLLDFEVAHWGDPAFDTAFCLNHLVLPAIRFPERSSEYLHAASRFYDVYSAEVDAEIGRGVEGATIRELGCLLLARIDGKSKIPYITDEPTRDVARGMARRILLGTDVSLERVLDSIHRDLGAATTE